MSQVLLESPLATAAEKSSISFARQLIGSITFKAKIQFLWTWSDPVTELARWPCLGEWQQYAPFAEGSASADWKHLQLSNVLATWRTLTKHGVEVHSAPAVPSVPVDRPQGTGSLPGRVNFFQWIGGALERVQPGDGESRAAAVALRVLATAEHFH